MSTLNNSFIALHFDPATDKALKKSGEEYEKYNIDQKVIEKEQSLREIEEDIKKLKKPKN